MVNDVIRTLVKIIVNDVIRTLVRP